MFDATPTSEPPTVLLFHGAFAASSGWARMIRRLQDVGSKCGGVRSMAERVGADIVEVEGSHLRMISRPVVVTAHILKGRCRPSAEPTTALNSALHE
jgi:hypothetical protein